MTLENTYRRFVLFALTALFLAVGVSAQTAEEDPMKKVADVVRATGRTYTTVTGGALMVDTPKGKLLAVAKGNYVVMTYGQVLPKAYLPRTDAVLFSLMRLNDSLNFSKVGIDTEGDLFLRLETRMEVVNKYDLDRSLKQLVEDYDKVKNAVFQPAAEKK
ncbi:MAG TPA: hypothetical protein VJV05_09965 [Pyrinomonadaceae bacterium]|nr:hypothetical protein [Pyrinomonadaceae bacterium]